MLEESKLGQYGSAELAPDPYLRFKPYVWYTKHFPVLLTQDSQTTL